MDHVKNFYNTILKSSHPLLLTLHLSGKVVPIVFYLLGSIFTGFTAQFISVVLLLAFDFYFSKNVSGRKLVQLRWWYDSSISRTSTLKFESHKEYTDGPPINPIDSKLFWWSMYLTPAIWVVFGIMCLLRLKIFYLLLVCVAICLTGWNTYGYRCCDKWEPGSNGNEQNNTWFQLPSIPGLDNLQRIARVQNFFNSATGGNA
ncbi:hypothetical protein KAFR_0A02520 [Kazachstania africana CBS 2517]|uniref:Golgi apparatus membrane protein TVP23 n=1 Tax=Kazachstania africana (strain ATCC 22294 / BCRC 22015 / CBS 2517 / CECT 1963 / NBRC 1671 / NRRL Y-8276) TaxID=1071382 RepID=H2AMT8_KAZAF|nr:hypothetical protein KAFR_0A02520 [Kazachstania africana CBS 2517]CCF55688.1 hypothetical protein KAFR_0A02520 [Kazachstania africana CBS 2517]